MKRLYAFKTIKQILGAIDKNAGYSDAEKVRALDLALENNFVTSLTSLVVTGDDGPKVVATKTPSLGGKTQNWSPSFSIPYDDVDVGATSISLSFPSGIMPFGRGGRNGGRTRYSGLPDFKRPQTRLRPRTTTQATTTTTSPSSSVGGSGCKLVLFARTYLRGQTVEITDDIADLAALDFSDKLASLKVEGRCRWEIFPGKS